MPTTTYLDQSFMIYFRQQETSNIKDKMIDKFMTIFFNFDNFDMLLLCIMYLCLPSSTPSVMCYLDGHQYLVNFSRLFIFVE